MSVPSPSTTFMFTKTLMIWSTIVAVTVLSTTVVVWSTTVAMTVWSTTVTVTVWSTTIAVDNRRRHRLVHHRRRLVDDGRRRLRRVCLRCQRLSPSPPSKLSPSSTSVAVSVVGTVSVVNFRCRGLFPSEFMWT
ncbi:hypothetical protein AALP_AA7G216200 [Arabis alpina]|uniref:Uncharacterized protein n=1 Tax=Arabis alpina TaxID=50452 RepID=A0A087GJP3_ARAAL|nr:hypothetical protein AALP_AA7G216200 [Arabis alpina]